MLRLIFSRYMTGLIILPFLIDCSPVNFSANGSGAALGGPGTSGSPGATPDPNNPWKPGDPGTPGSTPPPNSTPTGATPGVQTDNFNSGGSTRSTIDMVWVIDNSGSMDDDIVKVRNNFSKFMASVAAVSDLKVALISSADVNDNGIVLQPHAAGDIQIDTWVFSTYPLLEAGMALCPRLSIMNSSPTCAAIARRIYSSALDRDDTRNLVDWNPTNLESSVYRDPLAGFFRPQALKMFVFVTDDDSTIMTSAEFDTIFSSRFPGQRAKSFAFIGLGSAVSPCQARTGSVYQSMTVASGGKYYNICDADWSGNFGDLTQKVIEAGQTEFTLTKANILRVVRVRLDGRTLASTEYQINGSILSIRPDLITPGVNHQIEVTYEYR